MALSTAASIAVREEERDVLQAKLKAIADITDFSAPGSLPNSSASLSVNHGEFYDRWQKRLARIDVELNELRQQEIVLSEYRGVA